MLVPSGVAEAMLSAVMSASLPTVMIDAPST